MCFHCLRGQDTACAMCFHCLRGQATAFPMRVPLPSLPSHCLSHACSTALVAKTLPLPCVSTALVAKTLPFLAVLRWVLDGEGGRAGPICSADPTMSGLCFNIQSSMGRLILYTKSR